MGPNGAGKSSLLGLLLRFTEPTGGLITAGGVDVARIDMENWRRQVTWVPQQPYLFAATVADNIALARAFLRDAPLLLLDEPTAHLDPVVAGQILAVIQTLMAGRTVILVTHRHGWPGGADRVLTLDHGRLLIPALDEPAAGPIAVGP
jgi:ABC-type transport system involved in cytochrome bd biosynthesis fused ATPase/permease subunit